MILVDSSIPMYLIGSDHPNKVDARRLLERLVSDRRRLVTDAEVLQEILHRYGAINRRDAIQPCFETLLWLVDEVLPVDLAAVQRAREIMLGNPHLTARDAVHVAVMQLNGVKEILSFDRHFDQLPEVRRIS